MDPNDQNRKQPPGTPVTRLQQVVSALSDRKLWAAADWRTKVQNIKSYIISLGRAPVQVSGLDSMSTRRIWKEAKRRIAAHEAIARQRAALDAVRIVHPDDVPKPRRRLRPPPVYETRAALRNRLRRVQAREAGKTLGAGRTPAGALVSRSQAAAVAVPAVPPPPPANAETHPYTVCMGEFRRVRGWWMEQARARLALVNEGRDDDRVALPASLNPSLVTRPHAPDVVLDQDLLVLSETVPPLLRRALAFAPRPLLGDMNRCVGLGLAGYRAPPAAAGGIALRDAYDWEVKGKQVATLNETEVHWLKFVLTGSCNRGLLRDLPHEGAPLFLCFAERLQRLMDDPSEDRLFRTAESKVPIETVLRAMHRGAGDGDGPNQKTRFSVYDAMFFCERLSRYGRCRFVEDFACFALVQPPLLDLHPEHLVWDNNQLPDGGPSWLARPPPAAQAAGGAQDAAGRGQRPDDADDNEVDDEVGAPRRRSEIATWAQAAAALQARRRAGPRAEVHDFFCGLAFRLGYTLRVLRRVVARGAVTRKKTRGAVRAALAEWRAEYERLAGQHDQLLTFVDVVRRADPGGYREGMTEAEALRLVRHNILVEAERNLTPLYPTRRPDQYFGGVVIGGKRVASGESVIAGAAAAAAQPYRRPPGIWDFAKPEVRGRHVQRFFSLDRWPPRATAATAAAAADATADGTIGVPAPWDPCGEDPADARWYRHKANPIKFHPVVVRSGPATFPAGDTPAQRQRIVNHTIYRVALSMGFRDETPSLVERITDALPFSSTGPPPEPSMPRIAPRDMPRSVDWLAVEADVRAGKARADGQLEGGDGDGDGDVLMLE